MFHSIYNNSTYLLNTLREIPKWSVIVKNCIAAGIADKQIMTEYIN